MEKLTDKIDRYFDGAMNAEEKAAFEKEINASADLQQQVDVQRNLRAGIERLGMKSAVSSTFRKMTLKNKIYKWGVATVAVTAIATAAYFGYPALTGNSTADYELPALNEDGTSLWADADRNLPTQLFEIDPTKDTVIETEGGLVFAIPANAFIHAKNPVTLEIREALTPMDIMKGGLSTTSDGQLLETGGMFYLNARDGEISLQIDPAKPIYANVPTNEVRPDMLLFTGERRADGSINWKNPKPLEKQLVPVDIHSLDFYPKGFLHVLGGQGYDVTNKKLTDSIYYSYSGRSGERTASAPSPNFDSLASVSFDGGSLFAANCASCHRISGENSTGPGLKGVLGRIPGGNWKYEWVRDNNALRAKGDAYANFIFKQFNGLPMNAFPNLTNEQIDAILNYTNNGGYPSEIDPARIAAIWNDKFQNTIIATKEFEERLQVIFQSCDPGPLEVYLSNLDKPLWESDSLVYARYRRSEFYTFYLRRDGGITIDQPHMKELQEYQETKRKAVQLAAEKTLKESSDLASLQDSSYSAMKSQQNLDDVTRTGENFAREFDVNLREAYRQLGRPYMKNPPANAYYGFNVNNTGWKNIDKYVFAGIDWEVLTSTANRTTLNYTDPETGEKAVIKYEELKITVADQNSYDQVIVYLASDSLPSFQKVYVKNGAYSEKLNELMRYSLVVIAQKGDKWYWQKTDRVKPGTVDVKLETIAEDKLRKKLNRSFSRSMGQDFEEELEVMIGERTYRQQLKKREAQAEIDRQIMEVIFPCWEVPVEEMNTSEQPRWY